MRTEILTKLRAIAALMGEILEIKKKLNPKKHYRFQEGIHFHINQLGLYIQAEEVRILEEEGHAVAPSIVAGVVDNGD